MNPSEVRYRHTASAIGVAMLVLLLLINLLGLALAPIGMLGELLFPRNPIASEVFFQICFSFGYLATFMLPVLFLRIVMRRKGQPYLPMQLQGGLEARIFLEIPATVMLVMAAARINSMLLPFVGAGEMSEPIGGSGGAIPAYSTVLQFILMSVVPGFCEEFLFRGAILTHCLPFGRGRAIFISALLFALMHQNPAQILYTFVAGILLGILYERTRNLWACTVVHVFNNLWALIETLVFDRFSDYVAASIAMTVAELGLMTVGGVCLAVLLCRERPRRAELGEGVFARSLPAADSYAEEPIDARASFRLFLTPGIVAFVILCAIEILLVTVVPL